MKSFLHSLFAVLIVLFLYSCTDNSASPIRNVKFDPDLLNRSALTTDKSSGNFFLTKDNLKKHLGTVYTKQVLTVFHSNISATEQEELLKTLGFVKSFGKPTSSGTAIIHTLELIDGLNHLQVQQAIAELQKKPEVSYAAPFIMAGTELKGISDELTVQFNNKEQQKELEQILATMKAAVVKPMNDHTFLVKVDKNSTGNALELANYLNEKSSFAGAQPTFLTVSL